jgi:acetyl esterase
MPLAPDIEALLARQAALGRPPLSTLTPAQAREYAEIDGRQRPPGKPVAAVGETSFAGPRGPVRVRVYTPPGTGPFPLIVYLHGGGFVICSLDTHDTVARNLAAEAGAVVVSVDYRMAPEHRFPAPLDDVVAAIRWVASNAAQIDGDPSRIVVAGDSAGGNLAAAAAIRIRDEGGPALIGQLLIYPVTDHSRAGHPSYREYADGFGLTAADMDWFFDQYVADPADLTHPHVSPLRAADLSGLPPAYIMTAEYDVLRDEAEAYAARLASSGVAVEMIRHNGLNHGCISQASDFASVAPAREAMVRWLRGVLVMS